jgi:hypothetical protein
MRMIDMKIILSKDDIEEIIKNVFNIEAMGWNKDGTITIDTVLEKIVNDKSNFNTKDLQRMIGRNPTLPTITPYIPQPYNTGTTKGLFSPNTKGYQLQKAGKK